MAEQDKAALEAFFETGDKPTQAQFADFIESYPNFIDDAAFRFQKFSFSQAQVQTLNSANGGFGLLLFPAPGVGKAVWLHSCVFKGIPTVTWQGAGTDLFVYSEAQAKTMFAITVVPFPAGFEILQPERGTGSPDLVGNTGENERIFLFADQGQAAATGTLTVYVHYTIIDL